MSSITLSPPIAVGMILFASSLWGSWPIALKHLGRFPLDAFILTVFLWSFVFVWTIALVVTRGDVVSELHTTAQTNAGILASTLLGGIVYQWGMRIWLFVIHTRGLIFTTSITSSVSLMLGTLSSSLAGGLPAGASIPLLALGTLVLLSAILAVASATALREAHRGLQVGGTAAMPGVQVPLLAAIGLCALSGLCTSAYPTAVALGLRSHLRPTGLSVLAFMAMLASGALVGALLSSGSWLTLRRRWPRLERANLRYFLYGILAGCAHYGGNIINAQAVPVISPTIAWPMGTTSSLWGVAWGYIYHEYRGVPRQVYTLQVAGIMLFIGGIVILTIAR